MARIVRSQAYVRAWSNSGHIALVGFAECSGEVQDEIIHGNILLGNGDHHILVSTGARIEVEDGYRKGSEIDAIATSNSWPAPPEKQEGGGLFMRKTRYPSSEGTALFIILILLQSSAFDDQTLVEIEGDLSSLHIGPPQCAKHLETMGCNLSQVLKKPVWGWEKEKWGAQSTMDLQTIDECMRLLHLQDHPEEAADGECENIGHDVHWIVKNREKDGEFKKYVEEMKKRGLVDPWDRRVTETRQAEIEQAGMEILREICG